MKFILIFTLLSILIVFKTTLSSSELTNDLNYEWEIFKFKYNKSYSNQNEEKERKNIFYKSIQLINEHNLNENNTYKMSINSFSDLTLNEFKKLMNLNPSVYWNKTNLSPLPLRSSSVLQSKSTLGGQNRRKGTLFPSPRQLPLSVDWRAHGYVTKPIYQGMCGCCWAIAVVGVAEAINAMNTGYLQQLSSQNIIDCATRPLYNSDGCNGGFLDEAYIYVIKNGISPEYYYPFKGVKSATCKQFDVPRKEIPIINFKRIMTENELAIAVAKSPVPVAIDADQLSFQMYSNGIYDDPVCSNRVNHAVLVVGYDETSWIIKNSWSSFWGENGFARIKRGKNMCGILTYALAPILG